MLKHFNVPIYLVIIKGYNETFIIIAHRTPMP